MFPESHQMFPESHQMFPESRQMFPESLMIGNIQNAGVVETVSVKMDPFSVPMFDNTIRVRKALTHNGVVVYIDKGEYTQRAVNTHYKR
jgi:hypothetical protein